MKTNQYAEQEDTPMSNIQHSTSCKNRISATFDVHLSLFMVRRRSWATTKSYDAWAPKIHFIMQIILSSALSIHSKNQEIQFPALLRILILRIVLFPNIDVRDKISESNLPSMQDILDCGHFPPQIWRKSFWKLEIPYSVFINS